MKNDVGAAVVHLLDRGVAAREGRRAGRQGLSVEETADTTYLVRLRRQLEAEWADIAQLRDRHIAELEAAVGAAEDAARALRSDRDLVVTRAQQAARERLHRYEELCAVYGRNWQQTHRDRRFARLGWRRPDVPVAEQAVRDD